MISLLVLTAREEYAEGRKNQRGCQSGRNKNDRLWRAAPSDRVAEPLEKRREQEGSQVLSAHRLPGELTTARPFQR